MQFDFKLGGKKIQTSKAQLISEVGFFWQKIYKLILLAFLLGVIFLGGYIWEKSLSGSAWSEEKKQEYLDAQNKSVVFNEDAYKKVISDFEIRKNYNVTNREDMNNIFKSY